MASMDMYLQKKFLQRQLYTKRHNLCRVTSHPQPEKILNNSFDPIRQNTFTSVMLLRKSSRHNRTLARFKTVRGSTITTKAKDFHQFNITNQQQAFYNFRSRNRTSVKMNWRDSGMGCAESKRKRRGKKQ